MNKAELIVAVAAETGESKSKVEKILNSVLAKITDELTRKDGKVQLAHFGTFEVTEKETKTGRNPITKQPMIIPAHNSVKFKASKTFKDAVQ